MLRGLGGLVAVSLFVLLIQGEGAAVQQTVEPEIVGSAEVSDTGFVVTVETNVALPRRIQVFVSTDGDDSTGYGHGHINADWLFEAYPDGDELHNPDYDANLAPFWSHKEDCSDDDDWCFDTSGDWEFEPAEPSVFPDGFALRFSADYEDIGGCSDEIRFNFGVADFDPEDGVWGGLDDEIVIRPSCTGLSPKQESQATGRITAVSCNPTYARCDLKITTTDVGETSELLLVVDNNGTLFLHSPESKGRPWPISVGPDENDETDVASLEVAVGTDIGESPDGITLRLFEADHFVSANVVSAANRLTGEIESAYLDDASEISSIGWPTKPGPNRSLRWWLGGAALLVPFVFYARFVQDTWVRPKVLVKDHVQVGRVHEDPVTSVIVTVSAKANKELNRFRLEPDKPARGDDAVGRVSVIVRAGLKETDLTDEGSEATLFLIGFAPGSEKLVIRYSWVWMRIRRSGHSEHTLRAPRLPSKEELTSHKLDWANEDGEEIEWLSPESSV